jgi:hypothetical protein
MSHEVEILIRMWFCLSLSLPQVPAYVDAYPEKKCDLLFIDGGHSYEVAKADIENFKALATEDSLVIMDDTNMWAVEQAWAEAEVNGIVKQEEALVGGWTCESFVDSAAKGHFGNWALQRLQFPGFVSTGRYVI